MVKGLSLLKMDKQLTGTFVMNNIVIHFLGHQNMSH